MPKKFILSFTQKLISVILFCLLHYGCTWTRTKTVYRSPILSAYDIKKIGFSQPASENKLNNIRLNASEIYRESVEDFFKKKHVKAEKHDLEKFELDFEVDTSEVRKICAEHRLDGYLCTRISFEVYDLYSNTYKHSLSLNASELAFVEIKFFDNDGELILYTSHNTGSSGGYQTTPMAARTIKEGTDRALKRLMKEIDKNN